MLRACFSFMPETDFEQSQLRDEPHFFLSRKRDGTSASCDRTDEQLSHQAFVPIEQAVPILRELLKRLPSSEELARRLRMSRQAIKKLLDGKSHSMRSENYSRAQVLLEEITGRGMDHIDSSKVAIPPGDFYQGRSHTEWARELISTFCFFSQRAAIRAIAKQTSRGEGHAKKLFYPSKQEEGYLVPVDIQECLSEWKHQLESGDKLSVDLEQIAFPSAEVKDVFRELAFHYGNFKALAFALGYQSNSSVLEMLSGKTKTVPALLYCNAFRLLRMHNGGNASDGDESLVVQFLRGRIGRDRTELIGAVGRLPRRGYIFLDELTGKVDVKTWVEEKVKRYCFQSPRAFMKAIAKNSGLPFTQVERLASVNSAALEVRRVPIAVKRCIETWESAFQEGNLFPAGNEFHRIPVSDGMTALRQLRLSFGNQAELAKKLRVSTHRLYKIFEGEIQTLSADLVLRIIDLCYSSSLQKWEDQIDHSMQDAELDDILRDAESFSIDVLFDRYVLPRIRSKIAVRRSTTKHIKLLHPVELLLLECDHKNRPEAKALLDKLLPLMTNSDMRKGDYPRIALLKLQLISFFKNISAETVDDFLSAILSQHRR